VLCGRRGFAGPGPGDRHGRHRQQLPLRIVGRRLLFAGPTSINLISFYNSLIPSTNTPLTDTFTLYLSTTNAAVSTFDTNAMSYPDGTFTQVFTGTLGSLVNGRLDIALQTAFNYNPAAGNLVLTVKDFTLGSGGNLFLDADKNVGVTNERIYAYGYDFNQGLVTGFNDAVASVPEPATWAMMVVGFGLIGGAMRRKAVALAA
jgi:hypothetical protein